MRVLGSIAGEGFECVIRELDSEMVDFVADSDIDADGANGQNGRLAAYMTDNRGSEHLVNGGMTIRDGRVVGNTSWFRSIVILGDDLQPRVFNGGIIASKTAYRYPGVSANSPDAYVDAETVPYVCVPPLVIQRTRGAVLGCRCIVMNDLTHQFAEAVAADVGPRNKVGEVSIELARRIGVPSSPRTGGTNAPIIRYHIFPGVPAVVDGRTFVLQRSNGTYV